MYFNFCMPLNFPLSWLNLYIYFNERISGTLDRMRLLLTVYRFNLVPRRQGATREVGYASKAERDD